MKEIRSNETINAGAESRKVEGYGVVFNSESVDLGGFTEIILPSAITEDTVRNSDILFLMDHNRERGLLARSKNGSGSLKVSVDENGVKYEFDAPNTALGDEVLEGLRRGDIGKCSFAFTVSKDSWVKRSDGTVLRTIEEIDKLYDISIVYNPAYEDTIVVNKRGLDELEAEKVEPVEERAEAEKEAESDDVKDDKDELEDKPVENEPEEKSDESDEDEKEDTESEKEDESKETESEEKRNNLYIKTNTINSNMSKNKKFSLIGTLNDAINMRSNEFVKNGQVVLPIETRAEGDVTPETPAATANGIIAGVAEDGGQTIDNQLWDLLTDLKDKMIINELGAQFITANSTIEIPKYDSGVAGWSGEIEHAKDAAGKFSSIKLAPLRLAAYMDISNTWLEMTSANAEAILRQELVNCIALKLQQTLMGNGKGDDRTPQGLLYNVTADTNDITYNDIVDMEGALEEANCYSENIKYAVSPSAKSKLRTVKRDAGSGLFVWEKNEIEGIPALSSNSLTKNGIILGDWSQLLVCFFGGNVRLTVDTISKAVENMTRVVVNLDVNYCVKRPECFVKRILK